MISNVLFVISVGFSCARRVIKDRYFYGRFASMTINSLRVCAHCDAGKFVRVYASIRSFIGVASNVGTVSIGAFLVPRASGVGGFLFDFQVVPIRVQLFFDGRVRVMLSAFEGVFPNASTGCKRPTIKYTSIQYEVAPSVMVAMEVVTKFL